MKKILVGIFCLIFANAGQAQVNKCYSDEYLAERVGNSEVHQLEVQNLYDKAAARLAQGNSSKTQLPLITIPVVVHVVYNSGADNLSLARVQSQLDVLNEDYRRTNADASQTPSVFSGLAVDSEIEFCLASVDPNGDPTDGIVRVQTATNQFDVSSNAIKYASQGGSNGWDRDQYLNIWVGRLQGGILGYATFPTNAFSAAEDGVVIGTPYFGRGFAGISTQYSEGRTCTHEVGHWLGLRHIWGDGACGQDDNISDTPNADDPYYNCPSLGASSTSCGSQDMYMNYMDYVDDDCMNMFTSGQKAVMQSTMSGFRSDLLGSTACSPDFALDMEVLFTGVQGISCSSNYSVLIQLRNNGTTSITTAVITYSVNGGPNNNYQWNGNLAAGQFTNVTLFSAVLSGVQEVDVEITQVNGGNDQYAPNNVATATYQGPVFATSPLTESFDDTIFDQSGWSIDNPDDDDFSWLHNSTIGAYGSNDGAAVFDNYNGSLDNNPGGTIDEMITPFNDISGVGNTSVSFDYAYAYYSDGSETLIDGLSVSYSIDCGDTWIQAWFQEGTQLATTVPYVDDFFPVANEWDSKTVNLTGLGGADNLIVKFTNHSGWGNRLWIDNININTLVSVPQELSADYNISLFPNPSSDGKFSITRDNLEQQLQVEIINLHGQVVWAQTWDNERLNLDLAKEQDGIYLVRVIDGESYSTFKLMLN